MNLGQAIQLAAHRTDVTGKVHGLRREGIEFQVVDQRADGCLAVVFCPLAVRSRPALDRPHFMEAEVNAATKNPQTQTEPEAA